MIPIGSGGIEIYTCHSRLSRKSLSFSAISIFMDNSAINMMI